MLIKLMAIMSPEFNYRFVHIYIDYSFGIFPLFIVFKIVSIISIIIAITIQATAINSLKVMQKKGWDLLFLAFVVSIVGSIVVEILIFNFVTLISSILVIAIVAAIGAYILFEVRSYFKKSTS